MRRPPEAERRRPRPVAVAGLALGGLIFAVALAFYRFEIDRGPTFCLFRRVTDTACPACGLTRATALALRGEWSAAVAMHPALPVLAVEAAALSAIWFAGRRRGTSPLARWALPLVIANLAGLLLFWIHRWLTGTLPA